MMNPYRPALLMMNPCRPALLMMNLDCLLWYRGIYKICREIYIAKALVETSSTGYVSSVVKCLGIFDVQPEVHGSDVLLVLIPGTVDILQPSTRCSTVQCWAWVMPGLNLPRDLPVVVRDPSATLSLHQCGGRPFWSDLHCYRKSNVSSLSLSLSGQVLESRSPWRLSFIPEFFWGIINFIILLWVFWTWNGGSFSKSILTLVHFGGCRIM